MIKKILAIVLAAVTVMLVLAACGKKPKEVDVNGIDKPVAFNDNGYAVFDEDGHIRIYDTDEKGKIIYDEQGNPSYKYFDAEGILNHDGIIDTTAYALKVPSGWDCEGTTAYKRGTDKKCKIMVFMASEDGSAIEDFVSQNRAQNADVMKKVKEEYPEKTGKMLTEDFTFGTQELSAYANTYIVTNDSDGKVEHYAVDVFVLFKGQIYDINYLCSNGEGYDESFDFISYVKENFIAK